MQSLETDPGIYGNLTYDRGMTVHKAFYKFTMVILAEALRAGEGKSMS